MRILVTGANGFVGAHLVAELLARGHEVVATGSPNHAATVAGIAVVQLDLSVREQVESLDVTGVDGVVHLAGLAAVGPSFNDPLKYVRTNAALEIELSEHLLRQGVTPRMITVSSGSLYDATAPLPLTEQSPVATNSPYAVSKRTQEDLATYYGTRGFQTIIARPFNHIGPGQTPGFLVSDLAEQIARAERGGTAAIMVGNLDPKRDYTDVRDIAAAYVTLLESGRPGTTYNICSGTSRSGHELFAALSDLSTRTDLTPTVDPAKVRPVDAPDIYGDHALIIEHTGWAPRYELAHTFKDVLVEWRHRI